MKSSYELIKKLTENASQNSIAVKSGVDVRIVNSVANKHRNFTADHLLMLVKAGFIDKKTALLINFHDNLKDKGKFELVASIAIALPAMQICVQFFNEISKLCILCKIGRLNYKTVSLAY